MSDQWATLQLQQDDLELVVLPGIGGRLWDVKFRDQSLLFQNPDLLGLSFDQANLGGLPTRSPQFGFSLWGGEKTWIAPDTSWIDGAPFPTLDSGPYSITSKGIDHVDMISGICAVSQLSVRRRITLNSGGEWSIVHSVTNHDQSSCQTGIWSVMMIDTPAKIGVAMDTPKIHPVFGDAGSMVAQHDNFVVADCAAQQEFKVGLPNPNGETLIKHGADGPWLRCIVPKPSEFDRYAHQYPVEIFNSVDYPYCEAEWHSPLTTLGSGETFEFQQVFRIWTEGDPMTDTVSKELRKCMS